jgi:hypothetical protein
VCRDPRSAIGQEYQSAEPKATIFVKVHFLLSANLPLLFSSIGIPVDEAKHLRVSMVPS